MTVTVVSGTQIRPGTFRSQKSYNASTGSVQQTVDPSYDVLNLGLSTLATVGLNLYLLATDSAMEGREVTLQSTSTGTGTLQFTGTATGSLIFTAATDSVRLRQSDGTWYLDHNAGATFATATA